MHTKFRWLDFIINYDIKYRMDKALFGGEDGGEDGGEEEEKEESKLYISRAYGSQWVGGDLCGRNKFHPNNMNRAYGSYMSVP